MNRSSTGTPTTLLRFRCSGCGVIDQTVLNKAGVQHWRRGREGEAFEVVCGDWQPIEPGAKSVSKKRRQLIADLKVIHGFYVHFVTTSPHERTADILKPHFPVGIDKPTAARRARVLARLINRMDEE